MKNLDKIIRYLDGEMNGEEKRLFEKELVGDKALKESKQLMEEIDRAIDDDRLFAFKEKLKETNELYCAISSKEYVVGIDNNETKRKINFRFHWKYAAAVVTFLIVISTVIFNFSRSTNDKIFASYYDRYEANYESARSHNRGITSNKVSNLISAVQFYDQGNNNGAIQLLEEIIKNEADNIPAHFFLGLSFIETKNYNKAIENLSFVITKNDFTFIEHAKWYLALCYVKSDQVDRAFPILKDIVNSDNYHKAKALDLLKKIN
jgi:predicted negative regulator of RcsB-dependent stress response